MNAIYQGHSSDGPSVQKHSCGGHYPFVLSVRETAVGRAYGLIGPGIDTELQFATIDDALEAAVQLKVCRDTPDAWMFRIEQLTHTSFGGSRHLSMLDAVRQMPERLFGGRRAFEELSMTERVQALVHLAQARRLCMKWEPSDRRPVLAQGVLL